METRPIRVLNINDEETGRLRESSLYQVANATCVRDVEELILDDKRPIDVFLVDVNMDKANGGHPEGLAWGDPDSRPYGPLLVLPFLHCAQNPASFVPYSHYWGTTAVSTNGYLVVALALLLSAVRQKFVPLANALKYMEDAAEDGKRPVGDPLTALQQGVKSLRKQIAEDDHIKVFDIDDLCSQVNAWQPPVPVPFLAGDGSPLAVSMGNGLSYQSVELCSLFLDVLDGVKDANASHIEIIRKELTVWQRKSTALGLYRRAIAGLRAIEHSTEAIEQESRGRRVKKRDSLKKQKELVDIRCLDKDCRRLAFLLAWVELSCENQGSSGPAARTISADARHTKAGVKYTSNPTQIYKRVCTSVRCTADGPGAEWHLTPGEKYACQIYADNELKWKNTGSNPWPDWMTHCAADHLLAARELARPLFRDHLHEVEKWEPTDVRSLDGVRLHLRKALNTLPSWKASLGNEELVRWAKVVTKTNHMPAVWLALVLGLDAEFANSVQEYSIDIGRGPESDVKRIVAFLVDGVAGLRIAIKNSKHGKSRVSSVVVKEDKGRHYVTLVLSFAEAANERALDKVFDGARAPAQADEEGAGNLTRAVGALKTTCAEDRLSIRKQGRNYTLTFAAEKI